MCRDRLPAVFAGHHTDAVHSVFSSDEVGRVLHRLFIARDGTSLRKEDLQKARELSAMIGELSRLKRDAHLIDAAAGKASVGLIAAELLPIGALTVIERDPKRIAACRDAVTRMTRSLPISIVEADVQSEWPRADAVVALHACGRASDSVIDQTIASEPTFLFLVPCCYGADVPFMERAHAMADRMGAMQQNIRRRIAISIVDLERTLRLEAAGYEVEAHDFVGATVTPHNLLIRARRTRSEKRMREAAERLGHLMAT
jgi:predicted RNA methylase